MKLDIRTAASEPRRQTFGYLARRFGEDRPATRYEEAVHDLQSTENFHYRPMWEPEMELHDVRRTKVVLKDFHVLVDPRQFYYGTYNISRAALEAGSSKAFEFAEKQGMFDDVPEGARARLNAGLIPLRHYEWGGNRLDWSVCDRGFGTPITSAAAFSAMDRLGAAQLITKAALALDNQTGDSLGPAKQAWLEAPEWQGTRHAVEDLFVLKDWFESLVALNFVFDGIVRRIVVDDLRNSLKKEATGVVMVTEMLADLQNDQARWIDAVIKVAAAESEANKTLLHGFYETWQKRAVDAATPLAAKLFGNEAPAVLAGAVRALGIRAGKIGIGEVMS
jgi:phenol hydroxylase P1 protein